MRSKRLWLCGITLVRSYYGTTRAYGLNTGEELWTAQLGGSLQCTPILTNDAVYLATYPGVIFALR